VKKGAEKMIQKWKTNKVFLFTGMGLVLFALTFRLLPHLPNWSPLAAIALFSGFYFRGSSLAYVVPLGALLLSDIFLGLYPAWGFVYAGFVASVWIGRRFLKSLSIKPVAAGLLGSSLLFFVVSNLGVWLMTPLYSKTFAGLWQCYVAALPFFRTSLLADLVFGGALFGVYALLQARFPAVFRLSSVHAR